VSVGAQEAIAIGRHGHSSEGLQLGLLLTRMGGEEEKKKTEVGRENRELVWNSVLELVL
jgi:hypothetical protein